MRGWWGEEQLQGQCAHKSPTAGHPPAALGAAGTSHAQKDLLHALLWHAAQGSVGAGLEQELEARQVDLTGLRGVSSAVAAELDAQLCCQLLWEATGTYNGHLEKAGWRPQNGRRDAKLVTSHKDCSQVTLGRRMGPSSREMTQYGREKK